MILHKIDPIALGLAEAGIIFTRRRNPGQFNVDNGGQSFMRQREINFLNHDIVEHIGRGRHITPARSHHNNTLSLLFGLAKQP